MYPTGYTPVMRVSMTEVYREWINDLKDRAGRARIQMRVDRLAHGNPGQHRNLTHGVSEEDRRWPRLPRVLHGAKRGIDHPACRRRQIDAAAGHQNGHRAHQKFAGVSQMPKATKLTAKTKIVPYDVA